jgi:predicted dehydrogenase
LDTIGVGLIGTGFMGKCHAIAWQAVKTVYGDVPAPRLIGLCDVGDDAARRQAAAFGFDYATTDPRKLINDPAIDVISVTAPNQFHAEMAIAALEAGKHVWCEKPMAPTLAEAEAMAAAAARTGKITLLGYNYIQNPAIRHIRKLLDEHAIGIINHIRVEMDEDFMADADAPFTWRSGADAGYGALDDFGVHPLSLLSSLIGFPREVFGELARPYANRPLRGGKAVENWDIATALLRFDGNISATLQANRAAWGRKGRIFIQIFGSLGAILFDQERLNEVLLFTADGVPENRGFRTVMMAPIHPPYGQFVPAPGHQLGFNELKIIECRQLIGLTRGEPATAITFAEGIRIERTVHAVAKSFKNGSWISVD